MPEEMNKNQETVQTQGQETGDPAENQEKTFAQADVDRIVQERLQEISQETAAQIADLKQREARVDCKEYLLDNGYPAELLDIIDTSDTEAFRKKADKAFQVFGPRRSRPVAPLAGESIHGNDRDRELQSAFGHTKHVPKQFMRMSEGE